VRIVVATVSFVNSNHKIEGDPRRGAPFDTGVGC
jgi:hypothetical protein